MIGKLARRPWPALLLVLAFFMGTADAAPGDPFPGVAAAYLVQRGGTTLWSHDSHRRLPPASLTKMMTLLVVTERKGLDDVVSITPAAARETGSRLGLRSGEKMTVRDLVAAALLASANDAAHALADHCGGSEERFALLMNERARQLGMADTRFVNATGHEAAGHYSTAADLAVLGAEVMKNPLLASLARVVTMEVGTVDRSRTFRFQNRNELVGRYDGAVGVKTGFTSKAGPCLVAVAEREGTRVLLVMLNAPDRWWQAVAMLDRAFAEKSPPPARP